MRAGTSRPTTFPSPWLADRPADIAGRQPAGPRLGYQGPDQGYALTLAARLRPELHVQSGEHVDDALAGCTAVALRRASMFGRAPVIHDLRIACTIWGFLDPSPPAELVDLRRPLFDGVANTLHHYDELRGARRLGPRGDAAPHPRRHPRGIPVAVAGPARTLRWATPGTVGGWPQEHSSSSLSLQGRASRNASRRRHLHRRRNPPRRRHPPRRRRPACRRADDVAVVADGLNHPWDAAFTPDGSLLVTQRSGAISVVRNGQVTTVGTRATSWPLAEGAMSGIAVDPAFDANRRIYTCYMTADDVRVVRWTVSPDWTSLGDRADLVTDDPPDERPPLRVPHEASGPTGSCGSRRAMPLPARIRSI